MSGGDRRVLGRGPLWLGVALGSGVLLILLGLGLSRGPTLDASVFMTITRTVAAGGAPYLDAWDHKPPGIYLVEAAASLVLPIGDWPRAWAVSLVASIGTLAIVAVLLARRAPTTVGALAVTLVAGALVLGCHLVALGGGYTEPLALFPATVALALGTRTEPSRRDAILAGLAAGCAVAISLQLAPALAAVLVVQALGKRRLARVLAYCAGAALVPLAIGAWLAAMGAVPAAVDALVVYNRLYVQNREAPGIETLQRVVPVLLIASPLLAGSLARLVAIVRSRSASPLEVASLLWIGIWLVYVTVQGDFLAHYAIAIAAPLMVLCGLGFGAIASSSSRPGARRVVDAVLFASLVVPVLLVVRSEPGPTRPAQVADAAAVVRASSGPSSRLFVWGNEPLLYLEADRGPASRYVYLRPLTTPGYSDAAQAEELLREWTARPPDVIVDASIHPGGVQAYPLLRPWSFGGPALPDALDPLRDFVRARYVQAAAVGDWLVYVPVATP